MINTKLFIQLGPAKKKMEILLQVGIGNDIKSKYTDYNISSSSISKEKLSLIIFLMPFAINYVPTK